jgi:hypothetical protein
MGGGVTGGKSPASLPWQEATGWVGVKWVPRSNGCRVGSFSLTTPLRFWLCLLCLVRWDATAGFVLVDDTAVLLGSASCGDPV